MLNIQNFSKIYGAETILHEISFVINPGEHVGLVGPNGSGKSTLLKVISGEETAESGVIVRAPGATIGYLPQGLPLDETMTVADVILSGIPDWGPALQTLERTTKQLSLTEEEGLSGAMDAYSRALARFDALGGYSVEHQVEKVASGLGLQDLDRRIADLSGGQRTRAGLAKVLLTAPDILLLDEPTNHLDIEALEWLEGFLNAYAGAALIVSHDRVFLDRTVNRIFALDPDTHGIREYPGNYSAYAAIAAAEQQRHRERWTDQQAEIQRMEADIHRTKMHAKSVELTTTSRQPNVRRYAKKVAKKAGSREKKLERFLESDEVLEKPIQGWKMKLEFEETMRSGQQVLDIEGLFFAYPGHPMLLKSLRLHALYGERIALLGRNGSGKSTLLKIISGALEADSGTVRIGTSVKLGYMPQEQETLPPGETPLTIIQHSRPMAETEARNFLHYFLFEGDGALLPVEKLSYGERARLILAKLVVAGSNFLILDEPVNHLDITSRERFEAALDAFPGTVMAAVHDRTFINKFARRVITLDDGRLT